MFYLQNYINRKQLFYENKLDLHEYNVWNKIKTTNRNVYM